MSTKFNLLTSTAALVRSPPDRAGEGVSSYSRRPADPAVAARERGAVVAEAKPKAPGTEPGRPQTSRGPPPVGAYSVAEFCRAHAISQSFFFKLQALGRGPAVMRIGARTLISIEAAKAWREANETAPQAAQ